MRSSVERHRVQAALPTLAAWQGDIQRLGLQLGLQFGIGQAPGAVRSALPRWPAWPG